MLLLRYISTFVLLLAGIGRLTGQSANFTAIPIEGCDSIQVNFTNTSITAGLDVSYSWDFGNGITSTRSSPSPVWYNKPGVYLAKLTMVQTDNTDNKFSHIDTIFVRPHPNANYFVADSFQLGGLTYRFLSGKAPTDTITYRYVWTLYNDSSGSLIYSKTHTTANCISPGPGSSHINRDTLIYKFAQSGSYVMRLQVSDYYGCVDTFRQRFLVSAQLVIPKVFTPNGDNIDDFFIVQTNGRTVFSFKVYSMTGQLIFKSESRSIIWDGKMINGSAAWPGTYVCIIESVSGEPVKRQAGFFMLLK